MNESAIPTGQAASSGEVSARIERATSTVLLTLSAAGFLISLDRSIFAPLLPALATDLGQPIVVVALAVSAYSIPYGFFQLFYGPVGDRVGKVNVIRWAFLCFSVGTALCAIVSTVGSLYLLRAITGAAAASVISLALAFIGDVVPYERRQPAITNLMGATSLGNALSTALGGIVGEFLSWRALFVLCGLVALVVAGTLFRVSGAASKATVKPPTSTNPVAQYLELLSLRKARLLFLIVGLEGVTVWGGFTYLGAYMRDRFGLSYLTIGLVLALYGTGTVLTSRIVGRVLRRRAETDLIVVGGVLLTASYLVIAVVSWWPFLPLSLFAMGAGFALFHSTLQTRATELIPSLRGTSVAVFAFSLFLGGGIGTAALGWLLGIGGYTPVIVTSGLVVGLVTALARKTW
jgi:predicted MFS family arabinose efflux permease